MTPGIALDECQRLVRSPTCRGIKDRWIALRSGKIPSLQEFLSNPDPKLQPSTVLVDVVSPEMLRIRLFATELVKVAGIELTGANLLDFAGSSETAAELWKTTHLITDHPCGLWSHKLASTASGRHVTIEEVSFPVVPFSGGAPCLASGIALVKALEYRDTVFRLERYTDACWIDIGFGVPKVDIAIHPLQAT